MSPAPETLILGWGNPGRLDDGLGPAFVEAVAQLDPPGVVVDSDYQLTIEDAAEVARHARVVFVDADRVGPAPFRLERLHASERGPGFSTHGVSPAVVLSLSRDLFGAEPEAWLLGIRGYEFDGFGEGLSERARENLARAVASLRAAIESGEFPGDAQAGGSPPRDPDREREPCLT
jgi:hydrogenase maturation protease